MRVLMFGWEFPPHISGGLGTACYGLTKGLSYFDDMDILFVVPKAFGDEDQSKLRLIGANDVVLSEQNIHYQDLMEKIRFMEVNSNIIPYTDPEEYFKLLEQDKSGKKQFVYAHFSGKLEFTGGYGANLYQEIANYAAVATDIAAARDFDVIHSHDWLTYPAGMAAKQVSGKPLVVHVHATDFDRSGGNVNPGVYEMEKRGMEAADKVITVSNLTRNTVIHNYGIAADKVVTVYNAVDPVVQQENIIVKKGFDEKIVTFLGRITMQKGPEYFIEVAKKVLQKMDNVRFVMAGSGDMMIKMIWHAEPFGISPLEAMQSNVPVIISHQSGVAEILKHAIKVDFWDIDAMADAIYGILNYEALSRTFKKYGKEEVEDLKWENSARKVREVYTTLV
jgi:glycosyltransferase involved in cell wall biosynthesis